MIDGVTNADAIPVLERLMQFAAARHRLIVHDIANLSTPGFVPVDVPVEEFREQLGRAIDERRRRGGAGGGPLPLQDSRHVQVRDDGLTVHPRPVHEGILFHDRSERDLERTMQSLVENFMTFRAAAQLLRSRVELINTAIRERL